MSQKGTCSLTTTHHQCRCAATFQPVSSIPFTRLRRAASRKACHVASPRRAARVTARHTVLRLTWSPTPSRSTVATSAGGIPKRLFIVMAHASASGPRCTAAAPNASDVCRGSRPGTRRRQTVQRPIAMSNRFQTVFRTISCCKLGLDHFDRAPAGTVRGARHRDHLVDVIRPRLTVPRPIARAGLAAGPPRAARSLAAGKGSRLPFGGALDLLQLPLQPRVLVTQLISFALQALGPLAPLLVFFPEVFILAASTPPLGAKRSQRALEVLNHGKRMNPLHRNSRYGNSRRLSSGISRSVRSP